VSKTVELLRNMRSAIDKGWCQGVSSRNRQGNPVVSYSDEASHWCLIGSVHAKLPIPSPSIISSIFDIITKLLADRNEKPDLAMYNDNPARTKEEILELLDEAISVASVGGYE